MGWSLLPGAVLSLALVSTVPTTAPLTNDFCATEELQSTQVTSELRVGASGVDEPVITSVTTISFPVSWSSSRSLRMNREGSEFQSSLKCFIAEQEWVHRETAPKIEFSTTHVTITDTADQQMGAWSDYPRDLGPWRIEAVNDRFIRLRLDPKTLTQATWTVTLRVEDIRVHEQSPLPDYDNGANEMRWNLDKGAVSNSQVTAVLDPGINDALALKWGHGSWRRLHFASWFVASTILFWIGLWFARRSRAAPGAREDKLMRRLPLLIILISLYPFLFAPIYAGSDPLSKARLASIAFVAVAAFAFLLSLDSNRRWHRSPAKLLVISAVTLSIFILLSPDSLGLYDDFVPLKIEDVPDRLRDLGPSMWALIPLLTGTALAIGSVLLLAIRLLPAPYRPQMRLARQVAFVVSTLLTLATLAQWVWFSQNEWNEGHLFGTPHKHGLEAATYVVSGAPFYSDGLFYVFIGSMWFLGCLLLVNLLHTWSLDSSDTTLVRPREATVISLVFAALVTGNYGWYWGLRIMVPLLVAFVGLRYFAIRMSAPAVQALDDDPQRRAVVQSTLLDVTQQLDLLERRLGKLNAQYVEGGLEIEDYRNKRGEVEAEMERLNATHLHDGRSPGDLALAIGPKPGWWENGVCAARLALPLSILPAGLLVYLRFMSVKDPYGPLSWYFAPLEIVNYLAGEVGFWLAASFALGALWPYVVGRRGLFKGLVVAAVYLAADGAYNLLGGLLGQATYEFLLLRASLLAIVLALVGIGMDRATISRRTRQWNALISFYRLGSIGNIGNAVVYGLTIAATVFGLWQQIGNLRQKEMSEETVKDIAELLVRSSQRGAGGQTSP